MADTALAAPTTLKPRKQRKRPAISFVQWLTLAVVALFIIVPFYTTLLGGFKGIGELRTNPFGLPAAWDTTNFVGIILGPSLFRSLFNSLLIALCTVVLSILLICGGLGFAALEASISSQRDRNLRALQDLCEKRYRERHGND